jgi:hypothetical protein
MSVAGVQETRRSGGILFKEQENLLISVSLDLLQ